MFACYSIEYFLRKEFVISRLLEAEKKKVNEANLALEKTVEKRTNQLTIINKELNQEISEKMLSEAALRESEEKYRTIIESIEESYFEVDLPGNLKFFNESTCNILGYTHEELLGMNYREYTDSSTSEKMFKVFNKIYKTGEPVKVMDYGIIRKDGTTRILSMSTSLMCDTVGRAIGFRGIARDDTARKMAEETLKNVYNPFFTTKRSHGGTGLGMHIVYNLVTQKLGGHIAAESRIDDGTLFDIRVPLKQETYNELYN